MTGAPEGDDEPFCADGCGRPATCERLDSLTSSGDEIVELVCTECARTNP
jgi:hypothetical protein